MLCLKLLLTFTFRFGIWSCIIVYKSNFVYADPATCWPFNFVPFIIQPEFSPFQRNYIKEQIAKLNRNTCIYWSDITETESLRNLTTYVRFERATEGSCNTDIHWPLGQDGLQAIVALPDHCFEGRYVLHELIHALGFDHEHQRLDRDCYVWVRESEKMNVNFRIETVYYNVNLDRFPYDKLSVMHYRRSGDIKAIDERFYEWEPLGNDEERLTDLDLWKIQYRFCGRPHYCEINVQHCVEMEKWESDMKCNVETS